MVLYGHWGRLCVAKLKGQYVIGLQSYIESNAPEDNLIVQNTYNNYRIGRDKYIYQFEGKANITEDFQPIFRIIIDRRSSRVKCEWVGLNNNEWYKIRKQYSTVKDDLTQLFREWYEAFKIEFNEIRIV